MAAGTLHRLAAFSDDPAGGNPAGVWIGAALPPAEAMQQLAAELGYSETAFLAPLEGGERRIRYFSPSGEVPFCGHATIASGVVLGTSMGMGTYQLQTAVGQVPVSVRRENGRAVATLTSVEPRQESAHSELVAAVLACLGWGAGELDPALPPLKAFAGAWHLVLAARHAERLGQLDYPYEPLRELMLAEGLLTLQLIWRAEAALFHARNPAPACGIREDPATGSAAAALGGYLRALGQIPPGGRFTVLQGEAMGRPSRLEITIPARGGIGVSGGAVALPVPWAAAPPGGLEQGS
ncbi:PhzF family phenazine biosynthesis protein [Cyanobium sp. Morenito 9A2]|nr:PhzF family phenazine biosynthesis protein [Cyanobium sp. Morenito 9A2]